MITIKNLLELLVLHGGSIVSTNSLEVGEINQASAGNRMWVDDNSLGFVWMPPLNRLPETEEEVRKFETWFPIDEELPERFKTLDWFKRREIIKRENNDDQAFKSN